MSTTLIQAYGSLKTLPVVDHPLSFYINGLIDFGSERSYF